MFDRLIYRIKQLLFALSAKMSYEDRLFIQQYLDIKEAALFFSLPSFEQKHAVTVAYRMAAESKNFPILDKRKIIRLGLLHDIGKAAIRLSILDKVLLVTIKRFLPFVYKLFAGLGRHENSSAIFRQFYVHKHHGLIGSKMLEKIGESSDIVNEVAQHDKPISFHDEYMKILDLADSTY